MSKIRMQTKFGIIVFGIAIFVAGISLKFQSWSKIVNAILLLMTGFLLLSQVAWEKLINKKFENRDITSVVGLILGISAIIAGVMMVTNVILWSWLSNSIPYLVGIIGLFVVIQGIKI